MILNSVVKVMMMIMMMNQDSISMLIIRNENREKLLV